MSDELLEKPIPTLQDLYVIAQQDPIFNRVLSMYRYGHLTLEQSLLLLIRELHNSNVVLKSDAIKIREQSLVRFI